MIEALKRIVSWVWNAVQILFQLAVYNTVMEAAGSFADTSSARPWSLHDTGALVGLVVLAIGIAFFSGGKR